MAYDRKAQAWQQEEQRRYNEHREAYLRQWAREVYEDVGGDMEELKNAPIEDLQAWYNETHSS